MLKFKPPATGPTLICVSRREEDEECDDDIDDGRLAQLCISASDKRTTVAFSNGSLEKQELLATERGLEPQGLEPGPPGAPKPSTWIPSLIVGGQEPIYFIKRLFLPVLSAVSQMCSA
jgi:hypothetical protein